MTERNVTLLIAVVLVLGLWLVVALVVRSYLSAKRSPTQATQYKNTPNSKSAWDKVKILSGVISAIAALIGCFILLYNFFKSQN